MSRFRYLLVAAFLTLLVWPGAAAATHNQDQHSPNMDLLWSLPEGPTRTHSDIAIWGNIGRRRKLRRLPHLQRHDRRPDRQLPLPWATERCVALGAQRPPAPLHVGRLAADERPAVLQPGPDERHDRVRSQLLRRDPHLRHHAVAGSPAREQPLLHQGRVHGLRVAHAYARPRSRRQPRAALHLVGSRQLRAELPGPAQQDFDRRGAAECARECERDRAARDRGPAVWLRSRLPRHHRLPGHQQGRRSLPERGPDLGHHKPSRSGHDGANGEAHRRPDAELLALVLVHVGRPVRGVQRRELHRSLRRSRPATARSGSTG